MTKQQTERYMRLRLSLGSLGFTASQIEALLRCSRTLSTWAAHECNGEIQREGEDGTGRPYWYNTNTGNRMGPTADREAGALRRAKVICEAHGVTFYHQTDPRGCALWVLRPGDVPEGKAADAYYTRGIAVCID